VVGKGNNLLKSIETNCIITVSPKDTVKI